MSYGMRKGWSLPTGLNAPGKTIKMARKKRKKEEKARKAKSEHFYIILTF
jgi:hypothetical protein